MWQYNNKEFLDYLHNEIVLLMTSRNEMQQQILKSHLFTEKMTKILIEQVLEFKTHFLKLLSAFGFFQALYRRIF